MSPTSCVVYAITIVSLLFTAWSAACKKQPQEEEALAYPLLTPGWIETGHLYVRLESEDKDVFLFKHLSGIEDTYARYGKSPLEHEIKPTKPVYRFKAGREELEKLEPAAWAAATGPIVDCTIQPLGAEWKNETRTVWRDGKQVPTTGAIVLDCRLSPDQRRFGVLSADGPWHGSLLSFIGGGYAEGVRYHEVFRRNDVLREGKPLKLSGTEDKEAYGGCWSPDGRYLIWYDSYFTRLWIIDVSSGQPEQGR